MRLAGHRRRGGFELGGERSPELVPRRKLLKTALHYMYVDCDIGEKE